MVLVGGFLETRLWGLSWILGCGCTLLCSASRTLRLQCAGFSRVADSKCSCCLAVVWGCAAWSALRVKASARARANQSLNYHIHSQGRQLLANKLGVPQLALQGFRATSAMQSFPIEMGISYVACNGPTTSCIFTKTLRPFSPWTANKVCDPQGVRRRLPRPRPGGKARASDSQPIMLLAPSHPCSRFCCWRPSVELRGELLWCFSGDVLFEVADCYHNRLCLKQLGSECYCANAEPPVAVIPLMPLPVLL